jgi:hypothetical protein
VTWYRIRCSECGGDLRSDGAPGLPSADDSGDTWTHTDEMADHDPVIEWVQGD